MKRLIGLVMLSMVVVLALTGCRSTQGEGGAGVQDPNDLIDPALLGGDLPLGERTAFGQQVLGVTFEPVRFAYDSFQVQDTERAKIKCAADYMSHNPTLTLVAEGNCDERGSHEYNLSLGERRALAVRAYLVGLGIDAGRVQTLSYGEERPANPGHDEAAWAANRRVDFSLYK